MPIQKAGDETRVTIARNIEGLQKIGRKGGEGPRPLSEIAAFIGSDRTAPYQWASKRSRPTRRAVAGLALFEVSSGDKEKLKKLAKDELASVVARWLRDCGYPVDGAQELAADVLRGWALEMRQGVPSVLGHQAYDGDFVTVVRGYDEFYRKAVRFVRPRALWRLLINRLSQQEALEQVVEWHSACQGAVIANYVASDNLDHAMWTAEELSSQEHCDRFYLFVAPLGKLDSRKNLIKKVVEAGLPASKCRVWLKAPTKGLPATPVSLWAFHDLLPSRRFGRMLTPISADDHELSDNLTLLKRVFNDEREDVMWRYHSTPLQFEHALEQLGHRGVIFDDGTTAVASGSPPPVPCFAPADEKTWEQVTWGAHE